MGEKNSKVVISKPPKSRKKPDDRKGLAPAKREIEDESKRWLEKFEHADLQRGCFRTESEFGEDQRHPLLRAVDELVEIGAIPNEAVPQFVSPYLVHLFIANESKASELKKMRELFFTRLYATRPWIPISDNKKQEEWASIQRYWEGLDSSYFDLESVPDVFFAIAWKIYEYQEWHDDYAPPFVDPQENRMNDSVGVVTLKITTTDHLMDDYTLLDTTGEDVMSYIQSVKVRLNARRSEISKS